MTFAQQKLILFDSEWKYFKGIHSPDSENYDWNLPGYDDGEWDIGPSPFWYGDGEGGTEMNDMRNNYTTLYLRNKLNLDTLSEYEELGLKVNYDDGFKMWFNGQLIFEANAPDNPEYNSRAPGNHESGVVESYSLLIDSAFSIKDTNIVAVQIFNVSNTSSDIHFNAELSIKRILPVAPAVEMNKMSGFYTDPFEVEVISRNEGDTVMYTLDGSDPRYSTEMITGYSPVTITIDPGSEYKRGKTPGVIVRASMIKEGYHPSAPVSRSFLFINEVRNQHNPGHSWPEGDVNEQELDYAIDESVVNDARYKDVFEDALRDIPSVSIITDPDNLFSPASGIYVNAMERGYEWERPAYLEIIDTNGIVNVSVNAGVRIRGGWSRNDWNPKHAFRIFFRNEYGPGKLHYPLFGEEGADEYDKIDFRTSQNYSWSFYGDRLNTMNRDVFSRDAQRDAGQPYTRSRYYHLYLNGCYWGLFQSQERAEANYGESYFGGDKEEYDVIKVAPDMGYTLEATDGNLSAWRDVWDICQDGFADMENYYRLTGKDAAGRPDTTNKVLVDIDNLIDYMINIFYGGNFDAPVSKFHDNQHPNNFFAIYNRENKREGFKFFVHDAEHTLLDKYEDRVNIGDLSGHMRMDVSSFKYFHPQWLHHKLTENEEYRMRFADRVHDHFFGDGIFTPEKCKERFMDRANEINMAIIGESARWGDAKRDESRTKDDDWLPMIREIRDKYFPVRSNVVLSQLKEGGLYPTLNPPDIYFDDELIGSAIVKVNEGLVELATQTPDAFIVYTTNGKDPRATKGAIENSAVKKKTYVALDLTNNMHIKARLYKEGEWSALKDVLFITSKNSFEYLHITEINYHPPDKNGYDGKDLEFIEFKNTGDFTINLNGLTITGGIWYQFTRDFYLDPSSFIVIAADQDEFTNFYGQSPYDEYNKHLSNSGDTIIVKTSQQDTIISVIFGDDAPWPEYADGQGSSMVPTKINPTDDPQFSYYWRSSFTDYGSPFRDDIDPANIQELTNSLITLNIWPNPTYDNIFIALEHAGDAIFDIHIVDIGGKTVFRQDNFDLRYQQHFKLDLKTLQLKTGVYFVQVSTMKNFITSKFVYIDK